MRTNKPTHIPTTNRGFALVVTLSLMILLTVIAVGLLTLSSVSLRSSSQGEAISAARANARMALMLAIGELQRTAGLDTRVTARADLLDENNPPVLGVWKSWEGVNHNSEGRPIAPDYSDHKNARFLAWLTSASQDATMNQVPDTKNTALKVKLVGDKTVGTADPAKRQIFLAPTRVTVNQQRGNYAWWISGENQKARIPRPYEPATSNAANWSVLAKTHSVADPAPFGLDSLLTDASLKDPAAMAPSSKAITIKQADLLDSTAKVSQEYFHDLSVNSVGLLTNTATGGWRKDLSLLTENWDSLPSSNLPLFRVSPEKDLLFTRPTGNALAAKSILYYWADYRRGGATSNTAIDRFPPIGSWAHLADYATLYKNAFSPTSATNVMSTKFRGTAINGSAGDFMHKVRILPVISRVQWIYAHKTKPSATTPGKYDLYLVVQPVITLWNPYNVELQGPDSLIFDLFGSLPPVIEYKVGNAPVTTKYTMQDDSTLANALSRGIKGAISGRSKYSVEAGTFAPGETRVFSISGIKSTGGITPLSQGYDPRGGIISSVPIAQGVGDASTPGDSRITTSVTFDMEFKDNAEGVGFNMNMNLPGPKTLLAYRMIYDRSSASLFYPPLGEAGFPQPTLAEADLTTPFLSVTFGTRMASNTHLPSKGFVQSSPFVNYTAMGKKSAVSPTIQYAYPGTLHNVNSTFEFSFQGLTANSPYLPEVTGDNRGFIVTGFKAANGLSRCVIAELPGRPLNSLAELQNWDARYENPVPPYAFNLVGNSDATPLIAAGSVINTAAANSKGAENLQNDDSYCLNHVLFDDWFFSSIAPDPAAFGRPPSSSTPGTTYADFLQDPRKPLANRAYKAIPKDVSRAANSPAEAKSIASENVDQTNTSWKTIASRLEVEGMFNVNSTSVKAWRAVLGHARNQQIPYMGSTGRPELAAATDYGFSRFSIAGDVESKQSGTSGSFVGNAEYVGYRVFSGPQLDLLAEEIVKQVRLRGPFLSLAEFVNRQLSSGEPALAGAIQTALNKLETSPQNPFGMLQRDLTPDGLGTNVATANPPGGATGYEFLGAAQGYNIYGLPGWTRQADVLRPLAPILSARDDTFTIRAYGDARDVTGNIVKARAVCEATIRRSRDFVDASDDAAFADISNSSGSLPSRKEVNANFGRRFEIVSFRWLAENEI